MSAMKEMKDFDTVDHVAVSVSDVKGTVDWYLKNFSCKVAYQDETWALLEFANIRVAFVLPQQHPPHFALLRDPAALRRAEDAPRWHAIRLSERSVRQCR